MPTMTKRKLSAEQKRNHKLKCTYPACISPRSGMTQLCYKHQTQRAHLGSAHHGALKPTDYEVHRLRVMKLFLMNEGNAALEAALEIIQKLLDDALACPLYADQKLDISRNFVTWPNMPAHIHVRRIANQEVEPIEILVYLCSAYVFIVDGGFRFEPGDDEGKVLLMQLGTVFGLIRTIGGKRSSFNATDREGLGQWILDNLGNFLSKVTLALRTQDRDEAARIQTIRDTPLTITEQEEPDATS